MDFPRPRTPDDSSKRASLSTESLTKRRSRDFAIESYNEAGANRDGDFHSTIEAKDAKKTLEEISDRTNKISELVTDAKTNLQSTLQRSQIETNSIKQFIDDRITELQSMLEDYQSLLVQKFKTTRNASEKVRSQNPDDVRNSPVPRRRDHYKRQYDIIDDLTGMNSREADNTTANPAWDVPSHLQDSSISSDNLSKKKGELDRLKEDIMGELDDRQEKFASCITKGSALANNIESRYKQLRIDIDNTSNERTEMDTIRQRLKRLIGLGKYDEVLAVEQAIQRFNVLSKEQQEREQAALKEHTNQIELLEQELPDLQATDKESNSALEKYEDNFSSIRSFLDENKPGFLPRGSIRHEDLQSMVIRQLDIYGGIHSTLKSWHKLQLWEDEVK